MNKRTIDIAIGRVKPELVIKNARYLNVYTREILVGDIAIDGGVICGIGEYDGKKNYYADGLVVPGFIDGHIHIESSMLTPTNFAIAAIEHGTTTVVCDPHEIANVAGSYGIRFMIADAARAKIDFKFMLPSCVPATKLDENYMPLLSSDLQRFYEDDSVIGLAEFMDVPLVVSGEREALKKINGALKRGLCVDGHAPGISGKELNSYVAAGISSDHECVSLNEATEKLRLGQYIMIRQGTAAKNLRALVPLIDKHFDRCMFVTDDLHAEDLINKGHIDQIVREAIALGADPIKTLISATLTPATRFGLNDRGAIAPGKRADLVVLDESYNVRGVFSAKTPRVGAEEKWNFKSFDVSPITKEDIICEDAVIKLVPHELLTEEAKLQPGCEKVKLFCAERHHGTSHKAACYLNGYGIKRGAVASSIAHDSHNIIAAGYDDDIVRAVNELIKIGGGIVVSCGEKIMSLQLEIGGIMTHVPALNVAEKLASLKEFAYSLGVNKDIDPFMTLSFLSLPVIPSIRLLPTGVVRV